MNGSSATTASGNSIADLLLGTVSSASVTINAPNTLQLANYNAFFAQDDFRLTNALTLNLGVRFELEPGQSEANNRFIVGFDRNAPNPLPTAGALLHGGVEFAGTNGYPTHCCNYGGAKYSPRVGTGLCCAAQYCNSRWFRSLLCSGSVFNELLSRIQPNDVLQHVKSLRGCPGQQCWRGRVPL